ncbi:MAG: GNAT family N-acetyltransferase, partial [Actinomycetota bacterium]
MSGTVPGVDITLRPYRGDDESRVLELLTASLGAGPAGERPAEFFRWKHLESPFGPSFMLVAEDADRVVGLRAFMRWRFRVAGAVVNAVRAVDTAT